MYMVCIGICGVNVCVVCICTWYVEVYVVYMCVVHPLQYSCLENPHGQRSLAGYSPGVAMSRTQLSD